MSSTFAAARESISSKLSMADEARPLDLEAARRSKTRLEAVVGSGLLDTPPEESFDRLTKLAAKLIGVPVAFISVVDGARDYYKSAVGLDDKLSASRDLEGRTFCHYAIASRAPLVIADTLQSPDFRQVPTVQSLRVRAYAGIPLVTDEGEAIGSFCAVDFAPREWSPLEVEILTELAGSALREIKLRAAAAEAQKQTRSREEVLAVVAHDLRTPLNFVKMGAQLVAEAPDAKENSVILDRIKGAVDLMDLLIQDLLEVAKIEAGHMSIKARPVAAEALFREALAMVAPLSQRHNIRVLSTASPDLPAVLADQERIFRVFSNLIVNAVKFSLPGSLVRVTAERAGEMVRFSVIDSGAGIPPDHLPRIFDRFWQVNAGDAPGVGLGLAIAKSIVTAHGGTIGVTSTLGHGSDFHFDLPVAPSPD